MSQIQVPSSSQPPPPAVPTRFETDDGTTAIPSSNILNVNGVSSTEDNDFGITTQANPDLSDNLEIVLTNRVHGAVTTNDAVATDIITFPLTNAGTYIFEVKSSGFNVTQTLGAGYSLFGSVRSNGVDTVLVGSPDKIVNEEGAMSAADFNMVAGGVGDNNVYFRVTGIGTDTVNWCAVGLYCTRGA